MSTFLDTVTPSEAIRAMIDGLRSHKGLKDFVIDMLHFGRADDGDVCFGCAATCTLEQLAGRRFSPCDIGSVGDRAAYLNVDSRTLAEFEDVMDRFRCGEIHPLFHFCAVEDYPGVDAPWYLLTSDWEQELPLVEAYLEKLKALDTCNSPS